MAAGELREMIRFDRRATVADDGYGNTLGDWQKLAGPFAARIAPGVGSEQTVADGQAGINEVEITVRYCNAALGVNVGDRAVDVRSGRTFNIQSVINADERRQYLIIAAVSGVADG
jgi:SPP1 family predicted phage head-tail adaptor